MPELPEVERAAKTVKAHAQDKKITKVETNDDNIVYSGITHSEFAEEVTGRTVIDVARYGKLFYLLLDGEGRMPVLHFGMTGNILVKGEVPLYYKEGAKKGTTEWPPRFTKFILHLSGKEDTVDSETQIAFVDARRLGRIRLCREPLKEPPISTLGFDPILSMPPIEEFSKNVLKRTCPVKALLLDQTFSAGVGNWVADEVLYHARVHPEQKCHTLSTKQVADLHEKTLYVCQTAVAVNADSTKFPDNWLFNHRWGKGKKKKGESILELSSGEPATIKWITVGGRTSAYVAELQRVSVQKGKTENSDDSDSELTALSDLEDVKVVTIQKRLSKKTQSTRNAKRTKTSKF